MIDLDKLLKEEGLQPMTEKSPRNFSKSKKIESLVISRKGRLSIPVSIWKKNNFSDFTEFLPLEKKNHDEHKLYLYLMTSAKRRELESQHQDGIKQINHYTSSNGEKSTRYFELRNQLVKLKIITNPQSGPNFKVRKFEIKDNLIILDINSIEEYKKNPQEPSSN